MAREQAVTELQNQGKLPPDLEPREWSASLTGLAGIHDPVAELEFEAFRQAESLDEDEDWLPPF